MTPVSWCGRDRPRASANARGSSAGGVAPLPLAAAALFASALVLSPIVFTVIQATVVSPQNAVELLFRSVVGCWSIRSA